MTLGMNIRRLKIELYLALRELRPAEMTDNEAVLFATLASDASIQGELRRPEQAQSDTKS